MARFLDTESGYQSGFPREERRRFLMSGVCCWGILGLLLVLSIILTATYGGSGSSSTVALFAAAGCSWLDLACLTTGVNMTQAYDFRGQPRIVYAHGAVVAADNSRCSGIGRDMLKVGGHAVDAAVAAALCEGVVNPFGSGLGGGMFVVVSTKQDGVVALNGRDVAPSAASQNMYQGMAANASLLGGLAIAVPTSLKALDVAWTRYGRLPWSELLAPAAEMATRGFAAHPYLIKILTSVYAKILNTPALRDVYLIKEGGSYRVPNVGEYCCQNPLLGTTLTKIGSMDGRGKAFMDSNAATLAAEIQAAGGIVTAADIVAATPYWTPAVTQTVMGSGSSATQISYMPPPSSGGVVALALRILAGFSDIASISTDLFNHRVVEAMRHAFAVRMSFGDPGTTTTPFYNITPVMTDLMSDAYVSSLRSMINDSGILSPSSYGGKWNMDIATAPPTDAGTSHISVLDSEGNAVSLTTTINDEFGSYVVSPSTGFVFNDQMDDFSRPDTPNGYGLAPTVANFIAPGKRPLSSMSPIVVTQGGRVVLVAGANGGPRIISSVIQVAARFLLRGESLLSAVQQPRLHTQIVPMTLYYENYTYGGVNITNSLDSIAYLAARGNTMSPFGTYIGNVQAATATYITPIHSSSSSSSSSNIDNNDVSVGFVIGVSDARKDGSPEGY